MDRVFATCLLSVALWAVTNSAFAQQVTVQQPVVESFSVGTSVSVPDRGSMRLGGVSSAASGRFRTGPIPAGSALGLSRQSSSASAQVFIHDIEAIDAALLGESVPSRSSQLDPRLSSHLERRQAKSRTAPSLTNQSAMASSVEIVEEAERLAELAEGRGKSNVARLHWQRAEKHGSTRAQQKLAAR